MLPLLCGGSTHAAKNALQLLVVPGLPPKHHNLNLLQMCMESRKRGQKSKDGREMRMRNMMLKRREKSECPREERHTRIEEKIEESEDNKG